MMHERLRRIYDRIRRIRWDPSTDYAAEPIGVPVTAALVLGIVVNLFLFYRWRYQPMQDLPMHVACARYVAEWGRNDSPLTPLLERPDLLASNTLIYSLGGCLAKLFDALASVRFLIATFYIVGFPLATLYALRTFGRSAWGAVLASGLVFDRMYTAGFASELVACPLAILAVARTYRLLNKPDLKTALVNAVIVAALFLAHSFVFMWIGVVLAFMSVVAIAFTLRRGLEHVRRVVPWVLASVLPAVILLARWYLRVSSRFGVEQPGSLRGAYFASAGDALHNVPEYLAYTNDAHDQVLLVWLLLLVASAIALARLERSQSPPVLELVCVATFVSYFLFPVFIRYEGVVSMRQLTHAIWFLPVFVTPVSARTSRIARWLVIANILLFTYARTSHWHRQLVAFEEEEASGLSTVLQAAPPGLRLVYPRTETRSRYFNGQPLWHVEHYYAGKGGRVFEIPGATDPNWWIHFRPGQSGIRFVDGQDSGDWPLVPGVLETYDLVLVRRWLASPSALAAANLHWTRIVQSGDWSLWRAKR